MCGTKDPFKIPLTSIVRCACVWHQGSLQDSLDQYREVCVCVCHECRKKRMCVCAREGNRVNFLTISRCCARCCVSWGSDFLTISRCCARCCVSWGSERLGGLAFSCVVCWGMLREGGLAFRRFSCVCVLGKAIELTS